MRDFDGYVVLPTGVGRRGDEDLIVAGHRQCGRVGYALVAFVGVAVVLIIRTVTSRLLGRERPCALEGDARIGVRIIQYNFFPDRSRLEARQS
jgi:hypothetical protein